MCLPPVDIYIYMTMRRTKMVIISIHLQHLPSFSLMSIVPNHEANFAKPFTILLPPYMATLLDITYSTLTLFMTPNLALHDVTGICRSCSPTHDPSWVCPISQLSNKEFFWNYIRNSLQILANQPGM